MKENGSKNVADVNVCYFYSNKKLNHFLTNCVSISSGDNTIKIFLKKSLNQQVYSILAAKFKHQKTVFK